MSDHVMSDRTLDARPDRIDFRDVPYRPPLVSLPEQFPSDFEVATFLDIYLASGSIREQGTEGACTGFGLATCIDYIYWDRMIRERRAQGQSAGIADHQTAEALERGAAPEIKRVSPFMLYDIAKMYDEWEGEDYSGSSCRGALKGWHKHGVCHDGLWRSPPDARADIDPGWRSDAAGRPLGAYYRVDARSISDMQAAIHEVRAVYCSARVHDGWTNENLKWADPADPSMAYQIGGRVVPYIAPSQPITGGHAFAIVGYTPDGFIIQNSWGQDWGYNGFAFLTYEDWIENGNDAWVAALGAPMKVSAATIPQNRTPTPLALTTALRTTSDDGDGALVRPWSSDRAYDHAVVLGNEGVPLRRRIDAANARENLTMVARNFPRAAAPANGPFKVMIYAHGGMNSEKTAIERVMRMGPWIEANGVYPIFVVWRTSLLETLANIKGDIVDKFLARKDELRAEGLGAILDSAMAKLQNSFDKAFEVAAEGTLGKPVWSQMKQNADAAGDRNGGTRLLFETLRDLRDDLAKSGIPLEVHVVGHSAGAILLGHMLDDFDKSFPIKTATLFAPACTLGFALRHYARALERKTLPKGGLEVYNLSDENERDDAVGPYGKSILYLVSRALETPRKQPLLGLAKCLDAGNPKLARIARGKQRDTRRTEMQKITKLLAADYADLTDIQDWRGVTRDFRIATHIVNEREFVTKLNRFVDTNGVEQAEPVKIMATHGAFDNSLGVMSATIARILGTDQLTRPIDDLSGF
ncbi:MAG: C1 family peptidase [Paracoccaceae bacterium]